MPIDTLVSAVLKHWQVRECILNTDNINDHISVSCLYCKSNAMQLIDGDVMYDAKVREKALNKLSAQVIHKKNCAVTVANKVKAST